MIKERFSHDFDTLLGAIQNIEAEGYKVEFVANEKGFFDPTSSKTYLPESICAMEVIRVDAPFSEPDAQSILYVLKMIDGQSGWVSDAYGIYADETLAEHLARIKDNLSCKP